MTAHAPSCSPAAECATRFKPSAPATGPAAALYRCRTRIVTAVAGILAVACSSGVAEPARYEIDPEHATVGFLVEHVGYAKVLGRFQDVEGSYRFDEATGELSDVSVTVQTDSVFTGHEGRDDHLTGGDFLNSRRYAAMTFTAATATRTGEDTFEVAGELELLDVSRPLVLDATLNKTAQYPFGHEEYTMGVSARGNLKRSDFGMTYAVENEWVGDEVEIIIEFEALRQ